MKEQEANPPLTLKDIARQAGVISQNPEDDARTVVRVQLALAGGELILNEQEMIRIDIAMRDNLP